MENDTSGNASENSPDSRKSHPLAFQGFQCFSFTLVQLSWKPVEA